MTSGETKVCTVCKVAKTLDMFDKDTRYRSNLRPACGQCRQDSMAASRFNSSIQLRYGISGETFDRMSEEQGHVCAICGKPETRITRPNAKRVKIGIPPRLCLDHDHSTEQVRGLLCHKCNVGLGQFKDDIEVLKSAIAYLEKWQA